MLIIESAGTTFVGGQDRMLHIGAIPRMLRRAIASQAGPEDPHHRRLSTMRSRTLNTHADKPQQGLNKFLIGLVLALTILPATAIAGTLALRDAYTVARKTARVVARDNDADSWRVRRCWHTRPGAGYCTIRFYGYNGGAVNCFARIRVVATGNKVYGRLSYTNCPD